MGRGRKYGSPHHNKVSRTRGGMKKPLLYQEFITDRLYQFGCHLHYDQVDRSVYSMQVSVFQLLSFM